MIRRWLQRHRARRIRDLADALFVLEATRWSTASEVAAALAWPRTRAVTMLGRLVDSGLAERATGPTSTVYRAIPRPDDE